MNYRHILLSLSLFAALSSFADDEFTALEQQQISIATKGLFDKSDMFTIDFSEYLSSDYSFPLPVGKAKQGNDYNIEIDTWKGDAVKAMFDGTVRMSRNHNQFGNIIVVRHDNGLETVYGRNAQNLVKVGDRVKAGQTLAIVGGEGGRYYCEFAIMVNGARINPEIIISLQNHRLRETTVYCRKLANGRIDVSNLPVANVNPFAKSNTFNIDFSAVSEKEWSYPLPGGKVISNYGRRDGRMHSGTDIKTKANDNILAAFAGEVVFSGRMSGYGNIVRIRHANGLETYYSHNSKNLVKVGDRVKAGQVIALTGRTGRASTEHVHFEIRVNGQHFDTGKIFNHATRSIKQETITFTKKGNHISITSSGKKPATKVRK